MVFPQLVGPNGLFMREITFKSNDASSLKICDQNIKTLLKDIKNKEKEKEHIKDIFKGE